MSERTNIWKTLLVGALILAVLVTFAMLVTYNVKVSASILVSIDSNTQESLVMEGRTPGIEFVSLTDTPFSDSIKILRVREHPVWAEDSPIGAEARSQQRLVRWLDTISVKSYPGFPVR